MGETISRNCRKPEGGFGGWIATKFLLRNHPYHETNAVELCEIQPNDNVLEVGFGPGIGLEAAFEKIKDGSGSIHGVDFSPTMVKMASKRLGLRDKGKHEADTGKIVLHECSVTEMPFEANVFDSVFHCNCYFYWPDMDAAVKELYRVMKPGAKIVTTMNYEESLRGQRKGLMRYGDIDTARYMDSLKRNGFGNVRMKSLHLGINKPLEAILATKNTL